MAVEGQCRDPGEGAAVLNHGCGDRHTDPHMIVASTKCACARVHTQMSTSKIGAI